MLCATKVLIVADRTGKMGLNYCDKKKKEEEKKSGLMKTQGNHREQKV